MSKHLIWGGKICFNVGDGVGRVNSGGYAAALRRVAIKRGDRMGIKRGRKAATSVGGRRITYIHRNK